MARDDAAPRTLDEAWAQLARLTAARADLAHGAAGRTADPATRRTIGDYAAVHRALALALDAAAGGDDSALEDLADVCREWLGDQSYAPAPEGGA